MTYLTVKALHTQLGEMIEQGKGELHVFVDPGDNSATVAIGVATDISSTGNHVTIVAFTGEEN